MNDKEFREHYKPMQVPARFDSKAPLQQQVLFALAHLGRGTADDVIKELSALRCVDVKITESDKIGSMLNEWFDEGLLTGSVEGDGTCYSLEKITHANDGSIDPKKLAPGLD